MAPQLEVQLRYEDGTIIFAQTIAEAMKRAKEDNGIWKISWTDSITDERIRLVKRPGLKEYFWAYEPIVLPT